MSLKIPSHFSVGIDLGLDVSGIPTNYDIGISRLPKINVGIDPIEIRPIDFSLRIKEIPSLRVHAPADVIGSLAEGALADEKRIAAAWVRAPQGQSFPSGERAPREILRR